MTLTNPFASRGHTQVADTQPGPDRNGDQEPAGARAQPVIEVIKLKKIYRMGDVEVRALQGVDVDIYSGEMVAVMGPSGSGKSTLMNIIGCLDVPTEGIYRLDGIDISRLDDNRLAEIRSQKIGFVFQSFNLLARTSALANVELPLVYAGVSGRERRQRAVESLTLVGLGDRLDHKPNELSGGQQQRVAIARSLINRPKIVLADEPTGNLDSKTGVEIMELFQRLNQEQDITIVFVTHDPEIAEYCNRVIHIRDGEVERDEGRAAKVLQSPLPSAASPPVHGAHAPGPEPAAAPTSASPPVRSLPPYAPPRLSLPATSAAPDSGPQAAAEEAMELWLEPPAVESHPEPDPMPPDGAADAEPEETPQVVVIEV